MRPIRLTPRERDVLAAYGRTHRYRETAAALGISTATVGAHLGAIRRKLDAADSWEAVNLAEARGLLGDTPRE